MEIVLASPGDADRIAGILLAAFGEFEALYTPAAFRATTPAAHEIISRFDEGPTWIARDGETVLGTVSAVERGDEIYIRSMAVLPGARGCGVATQLLEAVQEFAVNRHARRLSLTTTPFLFAAIRLYERAGFQSQPEPLNLHGTPLIAMVKQLRAASYQT